MTDKQMEFCRQVVAGRSLSDAYRHAYDADGMSPESVHVEASRLFRHPEVTLTIEQGRAELMADAKWTRARTIDRLRDINDRAYADLLDGDRSAMGPFLQSLDRLARLHGIDKHTSDSDQKWSDMVSDMFSDISVRL